MDPLKNPFSPGAGAPPPELVGRDDIIANTKILLGRVKARRSEKSILLTGLRGVGKTVLLIELGRCADEAGYEILQLEAHEEKPLPALLAPDLRALLFQLDRMEGAKDKVKRGLAVLRSFVGALSLSIGEIKLGLDIDPERGAADSGDLEADLPALFVAVAEAAQDRGRGVALFIDEIQYLDAKELSALIMAMHRMQQKQLPLVLIGAGLPTLPKLAGESKSYAERLFSFPKVDALSEADAKRALQDPVHALSVEFDQEALDEIVRLAHGYPYFIQEWGYQSWNRANNSPITQQDVKIATDAVVTRLDENFFRVRFDRLTPTEKQFLRAMAELGSGAQRTSAIAELLGREIASVGPMRAQLMSKGMIYSPLFGELAFTVPLFDEFMKRAIPELDRLGS